METSKSTESLSGHIFSPSKGVDFKIFSIEDAKRFVDTLENTRERGDGHVYRMQLGNLVCLISKLLDEWESGKRPLPGKEEVQAIASIYEFMTTARNVSFGNLDSDSDYETLVRFYGVMFRLIPYMN